MALVLADRVKETTLTTGTGTLTLAGAVTGYQSFAAVGNGNTCYYAISAAASPDWEVGIGTYTASGTTLSRDTILASSNSGSAVNFGAGAKDVYVVYPSERAVTVDGTTIQVPNSATLPITAGGTGSNSATFSGANITSLNASAISSGTIANARTTASSSNGANTIVSRDASGNFSAYDITANSIALAAGTISATPANSTDIVNKTYVDTLVSSGVHYHTPVRVESPNTAGNLNATYNNGTAGVGATLTNAGTQAALVIDGVTLSVNDRVLIYNQTNQYENGVYTVTDTGSVSTNWVLTRATDADSYVIDSPNGLSGGSTFFVTEGDTGAGETYTCNTVGTITFGTTAITFAQVSSAQIYSANVSTGINLVNTTFFLDVVPVANGGTGSNTATFSGANITNLNASAISSGTISNARTTASSSNGASTIVARDASGNFSANTVTASLTGTAANATVLQTARNFQISGGATAANVSFDGSAAVNLSVTGLNASVINAGQIANTYTTASSSNGASTIVARDASGNFSANTVTASLTGTAANATVLQTARNFQISGGATAANVSFDGSAAVNLSVTGLNASVINAGTIPNANTTGSASNGANTLVLRDASGNFTGYNVSATNFIGTLNGSGANVSSINASNISSGTLNNARTTASSTNGASTIVARDASGNFTGYNVSATNFIGTLNGSGANVSSINAGNISTGTLSNARTTASSSNGASTIVARDASGNFTANTITATLTGTAANATVLQTARTIAISGGATGTATSFDGSANITIPVTALNVSTASAGTLAVARGGTGAASLTANNVILGNGTSAVQFVAPGTSGNVLSSNGTTWTSAAISGGQYLGSATPKAIMYNAQTIGENITVANTYNALSAGPITINSGFSVTVNTGAVWTIV